MVALLHRNHPRRTGLDHALGGRPAGGIGESRFLTHRHPAEESRAQRRTLSHPRQVEGSAGGIGDGLHPRLNTGAATGDHNPRTSPR